MFINLSLNYFAQVGGNTETAPQTRGLEATPFLNKEEKKSEVS
jgi:hypothetical protein